MKLTKPKLLMIIGAVMVFLLLAVWIYLLFFRTAPADDRFANLEFSDLDAAGEAATGSPAVTDTADQGQFDSDRDPRANSDTANGEANSSTDRIDLSGGPLQQLTTEPVVGFREISRSTSTAPLLYYMEAGTGHIYTINMRTGVRERRSNTTIKDIQGAAFSADGRYVAGIIGDTREHRAFTATLATGSRAIAPTYLSDPVMEYALPGRTHLFYTTRDYGGTTGISRELRSGRTDELFSTPIRSLAVAWGATPAATHHFYPRPSRRLQGFLAAAENGTIRRLPIDGYGLTVLPTRRGFLFSTQRESGEYASAFLPSDSTAPRNQRALVFPEKCAASELTPATVWCAHDTGEYIRSLPDTWLTGTKRFSDALYRLNTQGNSSELLLDIERSLGRPLDVIDLQVNTDESALYFRNKLDNTLWTYALR